MATLVRSACIHKITEALGTLAHEVCSLGEGDVADPPPTLPRRLGSSGMSRDPRWYAVYAQCADHSKVVGLPRAPHCGSRVYFKVLPTFVTHIDDYDNAAASSVPVIGQRDRSLFCFFIS